MAELNKPQNPGSQRIALVIQYLGTNYNGWQRQPLGRTIQGEIEEALASVVGHPVTVYGAGRTDAGVHAAAQIAHFVYSGSIPPHKWSKVLNSRLPEDILIRASALTPLIGRHNLAAFRRAGSSRKHSWVDVQEAKCYRQDYFLHLEIQADGFLYGMVRLLVGMLIEVGIGKRSVESFTDIWQNQRREEVKYSAPAKGLCLLRVGYPKFPVPKQIWFDSQPTYVLTP